MYRSTETIVRRLESLLARESVPADYVRLRIDILQAQTRVTKELGPAPPIRDLDASRRPMIHPEEVPLDAALAEQLLDATVEACRRYGNPGAELTRLRSAVGRQPGLLEELVRRAALGPDQPYLASLAGRLEVSVPLLLLIGRVVAAPFITHAARNAPQGAASTSPAGGLCPLCGSTPGLASLRAEDGRRTLHCSLCGHGWMLARLVCPFCASREEISLTRLSVDREGARWIEACEQCGHYLKVIDLRQLPGQSDFIPIVEEVAGLYLDLVAEREGCAGNLPYAAVT